MTGLNSGVVIRLPRVNSKIIHVWYATHKVSLVSYWVINKVPYLQEIQKTLINIFLCYRYFAPKYIKIKE